jgi:TonB-linked SusC/RagA family outer membrane protein
MRLTIAILIACLMQVSASSLAQKITLSKTNAPLRTIFKELKQQSGYNFFYTDNLLENAQPVNIDVKNRELEDVLQLIFAQQHLSYLIRDKTVIIQEAKAAERKIISGFVGDKNDRKPLPMVTVSVKGTKSVAQTDKEGHFTINVPDDAKLLEFRYLGYKTVEVQITAGAIYNIYLEEEAQLLNETVITGMSERKASTYTGAARTITGAELKNISASNIFAAISTMDPAFKIVTNNLAGGDINALPDIQMRGQNSFPNLGVELSTNPNQPLFILDGFEVNLQRVVDLDINLIASITLLKDASATSIYGSRGANGVMVITTIVPKAGKLLINFTDDFRLTTPDLSAYNLLNASEKLDFEKRVGIYSTGDYYLNQAKYIERNNAIASGVNTDWLKLPVQNGYSNRSSLLLQGGDQSIRYSLNFSANLQNGVMKKQDNSTYSGGLTLNYTLKKVLFSNQFTINQTNANNSNYGNFSEYVGFNPYWKPYNANGSIAQYVENIVSGTNSSQQSVILNPLNDISYNTIDNRVKRLTFSNMTRLRYDLSSALFLEGSFQLQKQSGRTDNFYSALDSRFSAVTDLSRRGSYTIRNDNDLTMDGRFQATFNKSYGRHQVATLFQANLRSQSTDYYQMNTEGFPFDRLDNILFAAQYQLNAKPLGDEGKVNTLGFTLSSNYTYDNRYFVDFSARRDGSSQYGTDKRYGTFYSVGLGWNIHNEQFIKNTKVINILRLRGSYGTRGSLNIPAYGAQFRYNFNSTTGYWGELGAVLANLGNPALSWQQNLTTNIGVDATLFNTRLNLMVNVYNEITKNALTQVSLPLSSGFTSYSENLGELQNRGFEADIRYTFLKDPSKGLQWTVGVNGFTNRNILKKLSNKLKGTNDQLNTGAQTAPNNLFVEGQSITALYVVRSLGIDPTTGSEVFLDKNGQKTFDWNATDKVAVGDSNPLWNGNVNTDLTYKGFQFGLSFSYNYGGVLYNQTLVDRVENVDPRLNVDRRAYDLGWKGPGDISQFKRITAVPSLTQLTSRFVQNNNYINLSSARLGYDFSNTGFVKKMGLRSLRINTIMNDVFRASTIKMERGINNPYARTYSLTLNAGF